MGLSGMKSFVTIVVAGITIYCVSGYTEWYPGMLLDVLAAITEQALLAF